MDSHRAVGRWVWDVLENRVTWDHELFRIYGLEEGELVPTFEAYLLRVHPDDRPRVERTIRQAYETGEPFTFEERIARPSGEVRKLISKGEVLRDASGRVTSMTGVCEDVTDRDRDRDPDRAAT